MEQPEDEAARGEGRAEALRREAVPQARARCCRGFRSLTRVLEEAAHPPSRRCARTRTSCRSSPRGDADARLRRGAGALIAEFLPLAYCALPGDPGRRRLDENTRRRCGARSGSRRSLPQEDPAALVEVMDALDRARKKPTRADLGGPRTRPSVGMYSSPRSERWQEQRIPCRPRRRRARGSRLCGAASPSRTRFNFQGLPSPRARPALRRPPRGARRFPGALPAHPRRRIPGHGPDPGRAAVLPDRRGSGKRPDWRAPRPAPSSSSATPSSRLPLPARAHLHATRSCGSSRRAAAVVALSTNFRATGALCAWTNRTSDGRPSSPDRDGPAGRLRRARPSNRVRAGRRSTGSKCQGGTASGRGRA